jgi:hypothetical protein
MKHTVNGRDFVTLFYIPESNICVDGLGNIVYDIFRFITPSQYMLFKRNKGMEQVRDISNSFMVAMLYVENGKIY